MHFKVEFLAQPENWRHVEQAQHFYICAFPFSASPQSIIKIAHHAFDRNKTLAMNLSAPYLCKYYSDPEYNIMPYVDILFGNGKEAATICKLNNLPANNVKEMALAVSQLEKKNDRKRIVVFTRARNPTVVAHDGVVAEYPVLPVDKALIKDTNGCGDAFVGGFLSQYIQGQELSECIKCGQYAAKTIIQYRGCSFPPKPHYP